MDGIEVCLVAATVHACVCVCVCVCFLVVSASASASASASVSASACVQQFIELTESLLETHLSEIGITAEDFVEICTKSHAARDMNTQVLDQLVAVEDFLSASPLPFPAPQALHL